jgi:hypothetical protein
MLLKTGLRHHNHSRSFKQKQVEKQINLGRKTRLQFSHRVSSKSNQIKTTLKRRVFVDRGSIFTLNALINVVATVLDGNISQKETLFNFRERLKGQNILKNKQFHRIQFRVQFLELSAN